MTNKSMLMHIDTISHVPIKKKKDTILPTHLRDCDWGVSQRSPNSKYRDAVQLSSLFAKATVVIFVKLHTNNHSNLYVILQISKPPSYHFFFLVTSFLPLHIL